MRFAQGGFQSSRVKLMIYDVYVLMVRMYEEIYLVSMLSIWQCLQLSV